MKFNFHYNKPKSQRLGKTTWTVHANGKCHFVQAVDCGVPVKSHSQKRQPRAIVVGEADSISFKRTKFGRKAVIR